MSLVVLAIGLEVYQVVAHMHCFSGRALPASHRSTRGFGAAIVADALSYSLACACLAAQGGAWRWLMLPLVAHIFYGCLLAFARPLYLRLHDYRLQSIYADASFCRSKGVASLLDTGFHLLAVVLLALKAPAVAATCWAAVGALAYVAVFTPARHATPTVQDQRA